MLKLFLALVFGMSGAGAMIEGEPWAALGQWLIAALLVLWLWSGMSRRRARRRGM